LGKQTGRREHQQERQTTLAIHGSYSASTFKLKSAKHPASSITPISQGRNEQIRPPKPNPRLTVPHLAIVLEMPAMEYVKRWLTGTSQRGCVVWLASACRVHRQPGPMRVGIAR
jgi:hypothetical protein